MHSLIYVVDSKTETLQMLKHDQCCLQFCEKAMACEAVGELCSSQGCGPDIRQRVARWEALQKQSSGFPVTNSDEGRHSVVCSMANSMQDTHTLCVFLVGQGELLVPELVKRHVGVHTCTFEMVLFDSKPNLTPYYFCPVCSSVAQLSNCASYAPECRIQHH